MRAILASLFGVWLLCLISAFVRPLALRARFPVGFMWLFSVVSCVQKKPDTYLFPRASGGCELHSVSGFVGSAGVTPR